MNVSLRLYRMHDLDLMMLKYAKGINFSKLVKTSLSAFTRKELYTIDLSNIKESVEPKTLPYISFQSIRFDEEKDKEIIELLKSIKDGYRNNFIKNIIRLYLSSFLLSFYSESNIKDFPIEHSGIREYKKIGKDSKEKRRKDKKREKKEINIPTLTNENKSIEKDIINKAIKEDIVKDAEIEEKIIEAAAEPVKTETIVKNEENEEKEVSQENENDALNFFMSLM